ncbi:MAG: hypothetical protein NXI16_08395 [Alphaproteobacteria bacterium]|nr:hypothetical protein [Alphaproteobacteria bacterium]
MVSRFRTTSPILAPRLTQGRIVKEWLPLMVTWMIMTAENSVILACMALVVPDPVVPFAAFGIAFALALFFESPVVMLMTASNRLVRGPVSFRAVGRFALLTSLLCSLLIALVAIPAVGRLFTDGLFNLRADIADQVIAAMPYLITWPIAVGVRRFLQGTLVRAGRSQLVGFCSVGRLVAAPLGVFAADAIGIEGGAIGAFALASSTAAECIAVIFLTRWALKDKLGRPGDPEDEDYSLGEVARFYIPLSSTVLLSLSAASLISGFLAYGIASIPSLAAFPPVYAVGLFFRSVSLSQQEIYIAHLANKDPAVFAPIRRFYEVSRWVILAVLLAFALTPASDWFFGSVTGLDPEEARLAANGFALGALYPWFALLFSWQRALLVTERRTGPMLTATVVEFAVTLGGLVVLVLMVPWPGLYGAMASLAAGHGAATLYLAWEARKTTAALD